MPILAGNERMKQRAQSDTAAKAQRWARRLSMRVGKVLAAHPHADPDNVRHTLILLEQPPLERLQRSLIRGRATAIFRK
jgi:hypothetical protein